MTDYNSEHIENLLEVEGRLRRHVSDPKWSYEERMKIQQELKTLQEIYTVCNNCDKEIYKEAHSFYRELIEKLKDIDDGLYTAFTSSEQFNKCSLAKSIANKT